MRQIAIAAAVISFGFLAGTSAALAADPGETDCRQMDTQVRAALANSQPQSGDRDKAECERSSGQQFCTHGYYRVGISHYTQALKLLGAKT